MQVDVERYTRDGFLRFEQLADATPHFTGGNTTADRPRRAYIFNFAAPNRRPPN